MVKKQGVVAMWTARGRKSQLAGGKDRSAGHVVEPNHLSVKEHKQDKWGRNSAYHSMGFPSQDGEIKL